MSAAIGPLAGRWWDVEERYRRAVRLATQLAREVAARRTGRAGPFPDLPLADLARLALRVLRRVARLRRQARGAFAAARRAWQAGREPYPEVLRLRLAQGLDQAQALFPDVLALLTEGADHGRT